MEREQIASLLLNTLIDNNIDVGGELDSDLLSLNIDSITYIKIVVQIESIFSFEFDDENLIITKFSDVNSMIDYILHKIYQEKCD